MEHAGGQRCGDIRRLEAICREGAAKELADGLSTGLSAGLVSAASALGLRLGAAAVIVGALFLVQSYVMHRR